MGIFFEWHKKQLEMFSFDTRFLVGACGRGFGKTQGALQWLVLELLKTGAPEARFITKTNSLASDVLSMYFVPLIENKKNGLHSYVKKIVYTKRKVFLVTGQVISFVSAEIPDNLRGNNKIGAMVIDEAGLLNDNLYYTAIRPSLMAFASRVIFIGTPKGFNWYHHLSQEAQRNSGGLYTFKRFTSYDNPLLPEGEVAAAESEMALYSKSMVRQEIYGEFVAEEVSIFDLSKAIVKMPKPKIEKRTLYSMGVDLAIVEDDTAIVTIDKSQVPAVVSYVEKLSRIDWGFQEDRINAVNQEHGSCLIKMDCSKEGLVADDLMAKYGSIIDKIKFNTKNKPEMILRLATLLAGGNLLIPDIPEFRELIDQLSTFERKITKAGNVQMEGRGKKKDDLVIALALAASDIDPDFQKIKMMRNGMTVNLY